MTLVLCCSCTKILPEKDGTFFFFPSLNFYRISFLFDTSPHERSVILYNSLAWKTIQYSSDISLPVQLFASLITIKEKYNCQY